MVVFGAAAGVWGTRARLPGRLVESTADVSATMCNARTRDRLVQRMNFDTVLNDRVASKAIGRVRPAMRQFDAILSARSTDV